MGSILALKNYYKAIGVMSGTSLDGLDLAFCEYSKQGQDWRYTIRNAECVNYGDNLTKQLKAATKIQSMDLLELDVQLGRFIGREINQFLMKTGCKPDFIASHGHTVFHQVKKGYSYQLGDGQTIAKQTGLTVVNDFRTKDIAYGGQGAPLVPKGDELLFADYDICVNLGGIMNFSCKQNGERIASDLTCCNMLLNHLAGKRKVKYDENGRWASNGSINHKLLKKLNTLSYVHLPFPKSTGYEWFLDDVLPILNSFQDCPLEDLLCTAVHHIADQLYKPIKLIGIKCARVLLTGGGANNTFLTSTIKSKTNAHVIIPNAQLINYKESLVFGLLGVLRMRGETNCLASATGAVMDTCGGVVYSP